MEEEKVKRELEEKLRAEIAKYDKGDFFPDIAGGNNYVRAQTIEKIKDSVLEDYKGRLTDEAYASGSGDYLHLLVNIDGMKIAVQINIFE